MRREASAYRHRRQYHQRVLWCLVASLSMLIVAFRYWPATGGAEPAELLYSVREQDVIRMEEIRPTRQVQQRRPPPPAPLPPVVVPNDVILEEALVFSDQFLPLESPADDAIVAEGAPEGDVASGPMAEVGPKPVRVVEPEYTREAQRRKVRAEVVVEVVVDERGRVSGARVLERYLLGGDHSDPKERVAVLGYGLEESALSAAERWTFRPARQSGKAVRSNYTLVFSFGV